jgi:hypothetical protein
VAAPHILRRFAKAFHLFHYREIWKWPKLMSMQAAGNDNNTTRQNGLSGYFLNRGNTSLQAV